MTTRVDIEPELLTWACQRGGRGVAAFAERFPMLPAWVAGERKPTLRQLETLARATHTPIGYFFLTAPPEENVPIPDLRTMGSVPLERPSPDMLDTIHLCQQRQDWYRDFARSTGEEPRAFVGSVQLGASVEATAGVMRDALSFDLEERRQAPTWEVALRRFVEQADEVGILVMVNGIVGNNTHRKLDPEEFRGFALADPWAPLVFVNGADSKSAQMFTLAHELAHIWLGQSALSDVQPVGAPTVEIEIWCNRVAAELLVPLNVLQQELTRATEALDLHAKMQRLTRRFKVSSLVILRRLHDAGAISRQRMWDAYRAELERLRERGTTSGGDFYRTQRARLSHRFASALVADTLEGNTLHRDAFRLLGFSKLDTFHELGERLGVA